MNKYSRTVLIFFSTLGLSLFTVDRVRASSLSSNDVYTSSSTVGDTSVKDAKFELFMTENWKNVSILENQGNITISTNDNLTIVTDPLIDFEPVESKPTIGIDFTNTLENGGDLSIDVGGDLAIFGSVVLFGGNLSIDVGGDLAISGLVSSLGTANNPGGNIAITANSIKILADPSSILAPVLTVNPISIINSENTENTTTSENGGVITLSTGGNITIDSGSLTLTSVPESSSIPSLLLIGVISSILTIKHKP